MPTPRGNSATPIGRSTGYAPPPHITAGYAHRPEREPRRVECCSPGCTERSEPDALYCPEHAGSFIPREEHARRRAEERERARPTCIEEQCQNPVRRRGIRCKDCAAANRRRRRREQATRRRRLCIDCGIELSDPRVQRCPSCRERHKLAYRAARNARLKQEALHPCSESGCDELTTGARCRRHAMIERHRAAREAEAA